MGTNLMEKLGKKNASPAATEANSPKLKGPIEKLSSTVDNLESRSISELDATEIAKSQTETEKLNLQANESNIDAKEKAKLAFKVSA